MEASARSAAPAASHAAWVEAPPAPAWWRVLASRILTFWTVELWRIAHDRTEIYTRAIQPALWLLIFGETFNRLRAIPTGNVPYLDYMTPGIIAQSGLFIAIFYGIQIIWERDAGMLNKLLATPTPRVALVSGKAFAAGLRSATQAVIVFALAAVLQVGLVWNPVNLLAAVLVVMVGSAFFSTLSMTIAGVVLSRDRLMGIGQAITMPLFFASNALYPVHLMPGWLQALSLINPLSYEVDALRGLLIGTPSFLLLDSIVLTVALVAGVTAASKLLPRLAR
jgi:ABC-2 type transport system permease protein